MTVPDLHYSTIVRAESRRTLHFYEQVLRYRFAQTSLNFENQTTCHLYFGNQAGASGSLIGGRVEADLKPQSALDALPVGGQ